MINVPDTFRAMPRWWHDAPGREWLDIVPALVASQCRRWGVQVDGDPLHGSNALVVPVRRHADLFALRLSPPGDDITEEAAALQFWAGRGTVHLFEVDEGARALLLERLSTCRSLQSEPLSVAIPVIAALTTELAVPAPPEVTSTATIAAGHVQLFERDWTALEGPTPRAHLDTAIRLADELAHASSSELAAKAPRQRARPRQQSPRQHTRSGDAVAASRGSQTRQLQQHTLCLDRLSPLEATDAVPPALTPPRVLGRPPTTEATAARPQRVTHFRRRDPPVPPRSP